MKKWHESKTLWFNLVTIFLGLISLIDQTFSIDPQLLGLVNGFGNVVLRFLTKEPIE